MNIDSIIDGLLFYAKYIRHFDEKAHAELIEMIHKLEQELKL